VNTIIEAATFLCIVPFIIFGALMALILVGDRGRKVTK
jgi:hypothetical protein